MRAFPEPEGISHHSLITIMHVQYSKTVDLEDAGATFTPEDFSAEMGEEVDDELPLNWGLDVLALQILGQQNLQ